jgi:hypothetical protein
LRNILVSLLISILAGCSTVQPPIKSDSTTQFKREKTAVAFFDPIGSIHYTEDVYLALIIAQVSSDSDYSEIWDSDSALSKIHANELSKIGLNTTPVHGEIDSPISKEVWLSQKAQVKAYYSTDQNSEQGPGITSEFKSALRSKGFANLILVSWSGFNLRIPTLGVQPYEFTNHSFWVFDLQKEKPIWSGTLRALEKVDLPQKTGKAFLESNDLAGLKREAEHLARQRYEGQWADGKKAKSVGVYMGFQEGE